MIHPIGSGVNKCCSFLTATFLTGLCLLLISQSAQANLTASVDRTQISEADVLHLSLRLENQKIATQPDFSRLQGNFDILSLSGPNQNTSITMINGRSSQSSSTNWELSLRAKRLGTLIIPAMEIANFQSQPIRIEVVAQSATRRQQTDQYVFFETEVDKDEIYVQGELVYTLRLYYKSNLDGRMSALEIDEAIVETLEAEKRYEVTKAGQRFFVLEKRYAIYPQSSGTLTIPVQTFSGSRGGRGFFSRSTPIMTRSNQHSIRVLPKPAAFTGPEWLPAKALTLKQSWSETPPRFIVGEPINRTLTIEASGVTATMLPEFKNLDITGARIYPDPVTDSQVASNKSLQSIRSTTVGILPTRAGTLVLPAISIPWWNTESNQMEFATIPASSFQVQAAAATHNMGITPDAASRPSQIIAPDQMPSGAATSAPDKRWQYAAALFLLLWLGTLYLYFRDPGSGNIPPTEATTRVEQTPQINAKELFQQLTLACAKNDAHLTHGLLLRWMKIRFPELRSIHRLNATLNPELLSDEIRVLEQHLYSSDTGPDWHGKQLAGMLVKLDNQQASPAQRQSLQQSLVPT